MEDQIITLLKNSELREQICQVMTEIYEHAGRFYDDPEYNPEYMKIVTEEDRFNEVWVDAQLSTEGEIETLLDNYVFKKLPEPHRIRFNEVLDILFDMAKADARGSLCRDCEYDDSAYTSFVNYVNNHVLLYRYSTPFPVCTILGEETISERSSEITQTQVIEREGQDSESNGKKQKGIYEGTIWSNDDGVCLRLIDKSHLESPFKDCFRVMAQITGPRMSESVWKEIVDEFERIFPSMWRFVKTPCKRLYELDTTASRLKVKYFDESNLPLISEIEFESKKAFVQKCIEAYFSKPTNKDSLNLRIRNAVHILIASDAQPNHSVGLALSVTAIEALLGQKGEGISYRLADNVAVLLEPDLTKRQKATDFVRDLYNKRSRVLHGEEIKQESQVRDQCFQLAAGVLHGMITYRDFLKGGGFDLQTPQDFLKSLFRKRFEPGQPAGLLESNVRELWRDDETR